MVTKKDTKKAKQSRVKIGKLQVNKETVEDLTDKEANQIKGGLKTPTDGCGGATRNCMDTDVAIAGS